VKSVTLVDGIAGLHASETVSRLSGCLCVRALKKLD